MAPAINPRALGWKSDGEYKGLSVMRPRSSFSLDFFAPTTGFGTDTYMTKVSTYVGKVNSTTFNGFAAGQVLFNEARGSHTRTDGWRFNFRFLFMPNRTTIKYGPQAWASITPTPPEVIEGWDVVEVFMKKKKVTTDGTTAEKESFREEVLQAALWRPYERVDLNGLFTT